MDARRRTRVKKKKEKEKEDEIDLAVDRADSTVVANTKYTRYSPEVVFSFETALSSCETAREAGGHAAING